MDTTSLTIGGFSQPAVARTLIEQSGSAEIGLTQRFLWCFPRPSYARFNTLEAVDSSFTRDLVQHLVMQWKPGKTQHPEPAVFSVSQTNKVFSSKFDEIQEQLETLASMDDLLSGMLSKSKGQILRVAAAFHVLFNIYSEEALQSEITDDAVKAGIAFVELCCQQTAYMAGRGHITDDIEIIRASEVMTVEEPLQTEGGAAHTLKLPRKRLDLAALTYAKKYRNFGWKAGALQAFEELEKAGLGRVEAITTKSGKNRVFIKMEIPQDQEGKTEIAKKLMKFNVSPQEYAQNMQQPEIQSPKTKVGNKRASPDSETTPTKLPRRSPRKNETYTAQGVTP